MPNYFVTWIFHSLLFINFLMIPTFGHQWKTRLANVPQKFLVAQPGCNPHNYSLIRNTPLFCDGEKEEVFLLILVRSIAQNSDRRQSIRKSWGSVNTVHQKTVKVAFLFGNHDPNLNKILQEEQMRYQDILQESFSESYANLHLKTVMAWKWAVKFCPRSMFVIVCNDEIFVDIFKVVLYLNQLIVSKQHKTFLGCWMEREGVNPSRNMAHRHGVSKKDYPGNHYAAFCNGNGYIASQQIIQKLYGMSIDTPPFMPDDAWNGILAAKLKLVISNIHDAIPIATKYKIIEQYASLAEYKKSKLLLFPLDRKFPCCEVCVVEYLWKRITHYNNHSSNLILKIDIPSGFSQIIDSGYQNVFFCINLMFNLGILICLYFKNKYILVLLTFSNILIVIIHFKFSNNSLQNSRFHRVF